MNKDNSTRFKSILVLFDLLRNVNQKGLRYLKQLYIQSTEGFEDCIDFISSLNLISIESHQFEISTQLKNFLLKQPEENEVREFVLHKLLNKRNSYVWEYLEKFSASEGKYIFGPRISENLHFSNLRNLFIELEFIIFNPGANNYEISEKYIPLFVDVIQSHSIHPEKLKKILEERENIGKQAELEVIEFEKSRLSTREDLLPAIVHKSLEDSAAGYDIRSFTLNKNIEFSERFIEVKAISRFEERFYLTSNELETSKKHGLNYYLYLVPVIGRNKFDLANLEIIQDPNNKIFNSQNWEIECEQFSVKRKETE